MNTSKTALVTGASRGIGQAILQHLLQAGHFVYGTATTEHGANAISDMCGNHGRGLVVQLSDTESVNDAISSINASDRTVEILVNNAGVAQDGLLMRMSEEMWSNVLETNLTGMYRITKGLLRGMMRSRWGRIINLGSVVGRTGNPGQANYVASKAGIEGFTRALALEVASRKITVNCVAPGFIETDMTATLPEGVVAEFLQRIPLNRLGTVDDVANLVSFLASDAAGYITAQTLHVNGGLLAS